LDHHCIWVRNCLGRENYFHFLAMLLSLAAMLAYGAYVGFHLLDGTIQDATDAARPEVTVSSGEEWIRGPRWSKGLTWSNWFDRWTWAFAAHIRVGAIALLAAMTAPLAGGLLAYHIYLIWHGMTTNESFKWEEWAEDVQDGYVYRCTDAQHPRPEPGHLQYGPTVASADDSSSAHKGDADGAEAQNGEPQMTEESLRQAISKYSLEELEPRSTWPIPPGQRLVSRANKMSLEAELLPGTVLGAEPWLKVESMEEVINIYDLGFWRNLKDALGVRAGH
jgi:palmitoyltransferase